MAKDALSPPSVGGSKKSRKRSRSRSRSRSRKSGAVGARLASVKNDLTSLGLFTGSVAVPGAIASAAHGYLGPNIKLFGKVDARLAAVVAALAAKMWFKPSPAVGNMLTAGSVGVLSSWLNEKAFDAGAARSVPTPPPAATGDDGSVKGIVVGNIAESGAFWHSADKRLAKKLARLKKKAEKKDIAWSEVSDNAREISEEKGWGGWDASAPAVRPVAVAPAYGGPARGGLGFFRSPAAIRTWAARHPRRAAAWAAAHPVRARRLGIR